MTKILFTREAVGSRRYRAEFSRPTGVSTSRWRLPSALLSLRQKSGGQPESGIQAKPRAVHGDGSPRSVTIAIASDTHELEKEIEVPDADVFIHCGDFTMFSRSVRAIREFNDWLGELPHRDRIIVPGNHDAFLENPTNRKLISNATILINEGVEIEGGLRIWGTPNTPVGPGFWVPSAEERRRIYARIPSETDVLISHGPPRGILDHAPGSSFHAGDQELLDAVTRVKPRLHVFGHIHGAYGIVGTEHTTFANAGLLGPDGDIDKQPIVLRMVRR